MEIEEQRSFDLRLQVQLMNTIKAHLNDSTEENKKQFTRKLGWLNDVTIVLYTGKGVDTSSPLPEVRCEVCRKPIPNVLMLLCHLETVHPDMNFTYLVDEHTLKITRLLQDPRIKDKKIVPESFVLTFHRKIDSFLKYLLEKIGKFEVVVKTRKFYKYDDIFREIREDEAHDSQEEIIGDIEENARERINSMVDVSPTQKEMFILWNSYVRKIQINYGVRRGISNRNLIDHLRQFIREPSLKPLRMEFVNHLSVLLFFGKLSDRDMLDLIVKFDTQHPKAA